MIPQECQDDQKFTNLSWSFKVLSVQLMVSFLLNVKYSQILSWMHRKP